jgi:hypothetical protein
LPQDEAYFRSQAARCRRLAADIRDPDACQHLKDLALEYDRQAVDAAMEKLSIESEPKGHA